MAPTWAPSTKAKPLPSCSRILSSCLHLSLLSSCCLPGTPSSLCRLPCPSVQRERGQHVPAPALILLLPQHRVRVRKGEHLTSGVFPGFFLLLVLHLLTALSPSTRPCYGQLAVEEGEDRRGPSQCLDVGCRGRGLGPVWSRLLALGGGRIWYEARGVGVGLSHGKKLKFWGPRASFPPQSECWGGMPLTSCRLGQGYGGRAETG